MDCCALAFAAHRFRLVFFLALVCSGVWIQSGALAQPQLRIPDLAARIGVPVEVPVLMSTGAEVQGMVIAVGCPPSAEILSSVVGSAVVEVGAELVVREIEPGGQQAYIGIVLDAEPPFLAQTIPPGVDQEVARFTLLPLASVVVPIAFVGGVGSPALFNVVVIGGLSIGAGGGLGLIGGSIDVAAAPPLALLIDDTEIPTSGVGSVPVRLTNVIALDGFVVAIAHDPAVLELESISTLGTVTEASEAEFIAVDIAPPGGSGGTLWAIFEFEPPFGGRTLGPGIDRTIAHFIYRREDASAGTGPAGSTALSFVDGQLGLPPVDNSLFAAGLSLPPLLVDGVLSWPAVDFADGVRFFVGDGLGVAPIETSPGSSFRVGFYYNSILTRLQGFELAVCYPAEFDFEQFTISGTVGESVGTEFLIHEVREEGDGGFVLLVKSILDFLPPFGPPPPFSVQTLPGTATPLALGFMDLWVPADTTLCESFVPIEFCSTTPGPQFAGNNRVLIDFESDLVEQLNAGVVFVGRGPRFVRGDCNSDGLVDLTDVVVGFEVTFLGGGTLCQDACDVNDDGGLDLLDTIYLLNHVLSGGPVPPAPSAKRGPDPTEDSLDCEPTPCD